MDSFRVNSSSQLLPSRVLEQPNESPLEGNVKLLLKLLVDSSREDGGCKPQYITSMMAIVEELKSRLQKLQAPQRRQMPQLRRCNTDLNHGALPRDPRKRHLDSSTVDDDQKLRHELSESINARRNLEKMFSSLGKEKEIIAAELARKVHELREAEELVEDLRTQNEALLEKVRASAPASPRHRTKGESTQFVTELQERNNALSEQLIKAIDEYWVMERRARDLQEDNSRFAAEVAEIAVVGVGIVRKLRVEMEGGGGDRVAVEELEALEQMLVGLPRKLVGLGPWPLALVGEINYRTYMEILK